MATTPRSRARAADDGRQMEMFPAMNTPAEVPQDDTTPAGSPPVEAAPGPASEPVPEPASEVLTAEERLLETIAGDGRASEFPDETAVDDVFPVDTADLEPELEPPPEPPIDEPVAVPAPVWDDPIPPPTADPVVSEPVPHPAVAELEALRDELGRITADRDDLAQRLDLAAAEFDKLHASLEDAGRDRQAATTALAEAQAALGETRAQLEAALAKAELAQAARDRAEALAKETDQRRQRDAAAFEEERAALEAACTSGRKAGSRAVAAGVVGAIVAALAGFLAGHASSSRAVHEPAAIPEPRLSARAPTAATVRVVAPPAIPAWPSIQDSRLTVREEANTLVVLFNEPLFIRGAELSPAGRDDVRRLAALLKPTATRYRFEVEGHADPAAVSTAQSRAANHELGLARARAALEVLTREAGLPANAASISSAGDTHPPFPGTTPEARRRNRTAVVKLHPVKLDAP